MNWVSWGIYSLLFFATICILWKVVGNTWRKQWIFFFCMVTRCVFSLFLQCKYVWEFRHRSENESASASFWFLQGGISYRCLLRDVYGDLMRRLTDLSSGDNIFISQPCRDNTLFLLRLIDEMLISEIYHNIPVMNLVEYFTRTFFIVITSPFSLEMLRALPMSFNWENAQCFLNYFLLVYFEILKRNEKDNELMHGL